MLRGVRKGRGSLIIDRDCVLTVYQPSGTSLDVLFPKLSIHEQDQIVATIARWMLDIFHRRFDKIGSLTDESGGIGPISSKLFYEEGRSKLSLDRGPFTTARAYYLACAQRELDACRMLFAQDAPPSYQRDLEDSRMTVERIAGMLCDLTNRCHGLDDDDPEMAPFSLDIHEIALKDIFVSPGNPTNIVRTLILGISGLDLIVRYSLPSLVGSASLHDHYGVVHGYHRGYHHRSPATTSMQG